MKTDKAAIQREIEERLLARFEALELKPLTKRGGQEESAFLAGAMTALQAVFGESEEKLTDYANPSWVYGPLTGRSVVVELRKEKANA